MSNYQDIISGINPIVNARWVEGFMRLEYGTLSHLPLSTFRSEINLFSAICDGMTDEEKQLWEDTANSFGL